MKAILTVCLAVLCLSTYAQTPLLTGNPLHYEDVIKTDSTLKQDQLYSMGRYWFANNFKDGKSVLQVQDAGNYILIGRGSYSFVVGGTGMMYPAAYKNVAYMIKFQFKDGRFKYELYNFNEDAYGGYQLTDGEPTYSGLGKKTAKRYYEDTKKQIALQVEVLKNLIVNGFKTPNNIATNPISNW